MRDTVVAQIADTMEVLTATSRDVELHNLLIAAARETSLSLKNGHKLLVAGNGGSAAQAQHIVAEFVGRLVKDRVALPAIALTTDSSILTAIGNDYGYEHVFARQIEALGQPGDVFLAISASGNSPNIVRALEVAALNGIKTVGLTGKGGGKMMASCDYCLRAPSSVIMKIQEAHLVVEHIFCMLVEELYFSK